MLFGAWRRQASVQPGCGSSAAIRVDAVWLAVDPLDMRAGIDTPLARDLQVFGAAHTIASGTAEVSDLLQNHDHLAAVNMVFSQMHGVT